jgi:hypothetical protein
MGWVVNAVMVRVMRTLLEMEEVLLQGQTMLVKELLRSMIMKICQVLVKDIMKVGRALVQRGRGIMDMGTLLGKVVKVEGETLLVKRITIIRIMKMCIKLVGRMVKAMLKVRKIPVRESWSVHGWRDFHF